MPELGRAALVVTLGLALYARRRRAAVAPGGRRRLAASAQNALFAAFGSTAVAAAVLVAALVRHDFSFDYVAAAHEPRAPDRLHDLGVLGRAGGLAAPLAADPDRLRVRSGAATRRSARDLVAWVVPVLGAVASFFAFLLVVVASPFDDAGRAARTASGSTRACRTRTWSPTRRCSTSATSA